MRKQKNPKAKRKKPARLERRVRVTFFLVAENQQEIEAVKNVVNYLEIQYLLHEIPVTGFTFSAIPIEGISIPLGEFTFTGLWWFEDERDVLPIIEKVVLFVIDFAAVPEEWKTDEDINLLKEKIFEIYEISGSPQKEIWIIKQDIYRYA